jgi:hypothetical protein
MWTLPPNRPPCSLDHLADLAAKNIPANRALESNVKIQLVIVNAKITSIIKQ